MSVSDGLTRFFFDAGSAILLFSVALGGAYLPRFLSNRGRATGNERSYLFQLGNMLSAGVMISACFCHLLAEALPETERAIPNFPLAPFLCALGYLLTLTADQFATRYSSHSHFHHHKPNPADLQMVVNAISKKEGDVEDSSEEPTQRLTEARSVEIQTYEDVFQPPRVSFLTALFLGLALSLHSVLEGLALGAQQTIEATKDVLIAIAAHKGLAAYALGASLVDSKTTSSRFWKVIIGFSIASPVGIFLGFAFSEITNGVGAASMSALASGTFLYVAMMEIIPIELENSEHILSKLAVMFLGFGAMSCLALWA